MDKIKNLKAQLSKSLARRKEIVGSMKETQYIEEKLEDICLENNSTKEADEVIKDLLGNNTLLQEEVKKLKRGMELKA